MDDLAFKNLKEGAVVRNKVSGNVYIVVNRTGSGLVLVRSIIAYNPDEWERVNDR